MVKNCAQFVIVIYYVIQYCNIVGYRLGWEYDNKKNNFMKKHCKACMVMEWNQNIVCKGIVVA